MRITAARADQGLTPQVREDRELPRLGDLRSRSDDSLRVVVPNGVGRDMKPFREKLAVAEIDAVVKYMHTLAKHETR